MHKIILLSHGEFAKATITTLDLIVGDVAQQISAISVSSEKTPESVYQEFKNLCDENAEKILYVFCDMYGGTPFNVALRLKLEGYEMHLFTGFNLPILLEVSIKNEVSEEEMLLAIKNVSKDSFKYINELIVDSEGDGESVN